MINRRVWCPLSLLLLSSLWGCGGVPLSSAPSAPFFLPTTEDTRRLAALTHELDTMALACLEAPACEQVHFARALISLFENREAACASFRRAIADNPSSPLASSSVLWLQLLGNEETAADDWSPLTEITAQFVRSVHDVSEGGLFVTLCEMGFNNDLGFSVETKNNVRKDAFLFGEAQGRAVVSVNLEEVEA